MNPIEIEPELDEDEVIDQLDDIYGEVEICGMKYSSGRALLELDPIAFHQSKLDLEDGMEHKWECGECGEQFETEDTAEDCCKLECTECSGLFAPLDLEEGLCKDCREGDINTVTCLDCGKEVKDSEAVGIPDGGNRCEECQDKLDKEEEE